MGHELRPRSGRLSTAAEIETSLRAAFAFVEVDAEEGTRRALALADWIEGRPERIFLGKHAEALAHATRLRALAPGEALAFTFGDARDGATLRAVALPGEVLRFGYAGAEDEERLRPLVERCARALDADVVAF